MTITSNQVSKTIGQILVVAAILAYWAPVLSYVGARIEANIPVAQMAAPKPDNTTAKNTTIAYEVFENAVSASAVQ